MDIMHNKIPNNVEMNTLRILLKCNELENEMPSWLIDYFLSISHLSANTRLNYIGDIKQFLTYITQCDILAVPGKELINIKKEDMNLIDNNHINDFIRKYCQYKTKIKNGETMTVKNSESTLSRKKSSITSLFVYLYKNNIIDTDVTSKLIQIRPPRKTSDAIVRLHQDEIINLINITENGNSLTLKELDYWEKIKKRNSLIICFFLIYGLRVSELQQLNLNSISIKYKEFRVIRKGNLISSFPLSDELIEQIMDYIETERKTLKATDEDGKKALFLSLSGHRLSISAIYKMVKKYTSRAIGYSDNDSGLSPHKLRATCASSLIEQGHQIYDVQALLDHKNLSTTELYAQKNKDAKSKLTKSKFWTN